MKLKSKILVISLIALVCFPGPFAYSAPLCSDVFQGPKLSDSREGIKPILAEKNTLLLLAQHLQVDISTTKVYSLKEDELPHFDFQSRVIKTFLKFDQISAQDARIIFSHEYTHGIFESYMTKFSSKWNERYDFYRETDKTLDGLRDEFSALPSSKKPHEEIAQRQAQLIEQMRTLMSQVELLRRQYRFVEQFRIAYHEFVADLVPTILHDDPNIMKKTVASLLPTPNADEKLTLQWRSFDSKFGGEEIVGWQKQIESVHAFAKFYNPYDLLGPLRSWVGGRFKGATLSQEQKFAKIAEILSVLQKDFDSRFDSIMANRTSLDPLELNSTLFKNMEQAGVFPTESHQ